MAPIRLAAWHVLPCEQLPPKKEAVREFTPPTQTGRCTKKYISDKKTVVVIVSNEAWDGLCIFSGNSYKAGSWLAKHVMDVANLSDDTIRSYLRIMLKKQYQNAIIAGK